jgi:hypothetical protein
MGIHIVYNPITGETLQTIGPDEPSPDYEYVESTEEKLTRLEKLLIDKGIL